MRIRAAREPDLLALREIVERAYGIYIERIGRRPAPMDDDYPARVRNGQAFVAEAAEKIVGLIVLVPAPDHLLIESVAVDPLSQGQGLGRSLLAHAETHAAERRIRELRLYTNAAMIENLALYPRLGYREQDRRTENGFERVYFSKFLDPSQ